MKRLDLPSTLRPRRARRPILAAFALVALAGIPRPVSAGIYPVGDDGICLATLAEAVAATVGDPDPEIRLMTGVHRIDSTISVTRDLVVRGGFAHCQSAEPTPGATSTLESPGSRSLRIGHLDSERLDVRLEGVHVAGPLYWQPGAPPPGRTAGGIVVTGPVDLVLDDVSIYVAHAFQRGGGLSLIGTAHGRPRVTLRDTIVSSTSSEKEGGGISCVDATLRLEDSVVETGHAAGEGGGIFASGCDLTLADSTLDLNRSEFVGGGLYSTVSLVRAARSIVRNNVGVNSGGGLFFSESQSLLEDTHLLANVSVHGAALTLYRSFGRMDGRPCTRSEALHPGSRCSAVASHEAVGMNVRESRFELGPTMVTDQRGGHDSSALRARSSEVLLDHAVFTDNSTRYLMWVVGDEETSLELHHASIHDNPVGGGHFRIDDGDPDIVGTPRFRVDASVFRSGGGIGGGFLAPSSSGFTTLEGRCLVSNEPISLPDLVFWNGPLFADDGIHLLPGAGAIDVCMPFAGEREDVDRQAPGWDAGEVADRLPGSWSDAGADEAGDGPLAAILVDGFESGDLSGWGG